jgi:hypothetical protein
VNNGYKVIERLTGEGRRCIKVRDGIYLVLHSMAFGVAAGIAEDGAQEQF